ncbi:MAG: NUDIX domain-containing protein [Armatimonadetes bacterium]|nr:NUDIX domain-containing protein [Armatimonadota bacterium]
MPISPYLKVLRARVGTDLVLMPGVAAVIRDGEGRVLLGRRSDDGSWGLPAGSVDPGEPPARTVVREVWEETGLHVVPERILGVFGGEDFRFTYPNGDQLESVVVLFECRVVGGDLHPRDGEMVGLRYFPADELPPLRVRWPPSLLAGAGGPREAAFEWDGEWLGELG